MLWRVTCAYTAKDGSVQPWDFLLLSESASSACNTIRKRFHLRNIEDRFLWTAMIEHAEIVKVKATGA